MPRFDGNPAERFDLADEAVEPGELFGIGAGEFREQQSRSFTGGSEDGRGVRVFQSVTSQPEFIDDVFVDVTRVMKDAGRVVTGMELRRGRKPAAPIKMFEHQHLAPLPGQQGSAGEAVVAAADDDGVVVVCHLRSALLQDGASRVCARRAHDATTGVGARGGEPEIRDGGAVPCPPRCRAQEE